MLLELGDVPLHDVFGVDGEQAADVEGLGSEASFLVAISED